MMKKALVASVIILIVLLIFSLSNPNPIDVKFFRHFEILPTILVLIAVSFGVIVGLTIALPVVLSKNEKIEKLRQQLKDVSGHVRDEVEKTEEEKIDKEKNA